MRLLCAVLQGLSIVEFLALVEPVILSEAKNPFPRAETLRCAQGDNRKTLCRTQESLALTQPDCLQFAYNKLSQPIISKTLRRRSKSR